MKTRSLATLVMVTAITVCTAQAQENQPPSFQKFKASDQVLRPFAKAYLEALKVRGQQEQRVENRVADAELRKALEQQGLTVETYNRIAASVNNNEQARNRVIELIEQERARS